MYLSAVSLLSHEHHFPPLRCSAARQGTKGLADIKTAGVLRYSHLQFGDATEGSCKRQCSKDRLYSRQRETRAVKLLARCSPKAAVAIRTPGFPGHALGKRQKNGGALLSEDASWAVLFPS